MKKKLSAFLLLFYLTFNGYTQSLFPKQLSQKFKLERALSKTTFTFISNNGKRGVVDMNGKIICNPLFNEIANQDKGFLTISNDTLYGVATLHGRQILPYNFDELKISSSNRFEVYKNGVAFIVDSSNQYVGPLQTAPETPHYSNILQFEPPKIVQDEEYKETETFVPRFEKEGTSIVLIKAGEKIITNYKELIPSKGSNILFYKIGSKWGLVNDTGLVITNAVYHNITEINDTYFSVKVDDKLGLINIYGETLLPTEFSHISPFDIFGNSIVTKFVGYKNLVGIINREGKFVLPLQDGEILTSETSDLNQGLYVVETRTNKNIYDRFLRSLIPNDFIVTRVYDHNFFVTNGQKCGIINEAGYFTYLINAIQLEPFDNSNKATFKTYLFRDTKSKWGIISERKEIIVKPKYDYVFQLPNGKMIVKSENKSGLISFDGKVLIPVIYDNISNTACKGKVEGEYLSCCYIVKLGNKAGLWNEKNINSKIPFFDDIDANFLQGLALAKQGSKYGFINEKGEIIIPFEFDWAMPFTQKTTEVMINGKKKAIDKKGIVVQDIF